MQNLIVSMVDYGNILRKKFEKRLKSFNLEEVVHEANSLVVETFEVNKDKIRFDPLISEDIPQSNSSNR